MTEAEAARLLEAIAADRLFVFCGAGLSMAPPSNLPSAAVIAQECSAKYQQDVGAPLDAGLQTDIAKMSQYFRQEGHFDGFFLDTLVPWVRLKGQPNPGHEAIADFLGCGALAAAASTNFDYLVEAAAGHLGEPDFRSVVEPGDIGQQRPHRPYLKLHGCEMRARQSTIWCPEQLADAAVAHRMALFRAWLATNLIGKDVVFVGFWSDWAYLTDILAGHLAGLAPPHVYLVDPGTSAFLEEKAPDLWDWAHGAGITFHHCQESGGAFLDELRRRWSKVYINRLMVEASDTYNALFGVVPGPLVWNPPLDSETLYALRRDLTGTPRKSVVRGRAPEIGDHIAGAIHRRLLDCGVSYSAHRYELPGRSIRVVSGRGRLLSRIKASYDLEPPLPVQPDAVICAGAIPDAAPGHIVRASGPTTIVRSGSFDHWIVHDTLVADLQDPHV